MEFEESLVNQLKAPPFGKVGTLDTEPSTSLFKLILSVPW